VFGKAEQGEIKRESARKGSWVVGGGGGKRADEWAGGGGHWGGGKSWSVVVEQRERSVGGRGGGSLVQVQEDPEKGQGAGRARGHPSGNPRWDVACVWPVVLLRVMNFRWAEEEEMPGP
jgi:hypothetical protein